MPNDFIDIPSQITDNTEVVDLQEDALHVGMDEEDFRVRVEQAETNGLKYWAKLQLTARQERNYKYWMGDQVDESHLRSDLEKSADNIIFRNLETMIPIATARIPEFTTTPVYKNDKTRDFARDVRLMTRTDYEVEHKMQRKIGQGIRNHQINLIAVFQMGYDEECGETWTEEVSATDIVVDKNGEVVIKYVKDKDLGYLLETFPHKRTEILAHYGHATSVNLSKAIQHSPVTYIEAWTDDVVGWKLGDIVLGVERNPHWDYEGQEFQVSPDMPMIDPFSGQPAIDPQTGMPAMQPGKRATVKFNHYKKPKKPFLFLTYYNRGVHLIDDTSLVEQAIGLQDWVNKRKRQIGMNADSTNGHWVSSGDYISEDAFQELEGGIDEKIWLESGKPMDGFVKLTGQPLPDYVYNDLLDSRASIDQLMGIESVTRGAGSNNKTATQDMMQRDQNYGRIDGYVRDGIETLAQDWAEMDYHLRLVYSSQPTAMALPEDTDVESDTLIFSRESVPLVQTIQGEYIPCPIVFQVKAGSTMPQDEQAEYQKAQNMKDVLRPRDYFKMINMPNPRELERNLLLWQLDPMADYQDDPEMQAAMMKQQQQQMMAAQQEAMAKGGGQPAPEAQPQGNQPAPNGQPTDAQMTPEQMAMMQAQMGGQGAPMQEPDPAAELLAMLEQEGGGMVQNPNPDAQLLDEVTAAYTNGDSRSLADVM